jgi:hypothetical protein
MNLNKYIEQGYTFFKGLASELVKELRKDKEDVIDKLSPIKTVEAVFEAQKAIVSEVGKMSENIGQAIANQEIATAVEMTNADDISGKIVDKLDELSKGLEALKTPGDLTIKGAFIKGEKGDKGDKGEPANEERIIKAVQKKIKLPKDGLNGSNGRDGTNGKDGKDGSPDTPKEIVDKIESLEGENRLDAKAIKNLNKFVNNTIEYRGGSTSLNVLKDGNLVGKGSELNFIGSGVSINYEGDNRNTVTITGGSGGAVDSVNGQTGVVVLDYADVGAAPLYHNHNAGIEGTPTITEGTAGDAGKISVASGTAWFFDDATRETLTVHTIAAKAMTTPTDDVTTYVCADRDTDTWVFLTDATVIDYLRYIPYFIVFKRTGSTNLHHQVVVLNAHGEVEANYHRTFHTDRYGRESGLDQIAVDASLNLTVDGGVVWAVHTPYDILPVTTATRQFRCISDGTITSHTAPVIDNGHYDNGTEQVLTAGKWVINYIYRGIEEQDHVYTTLSDQFDSLEAAQASSTITFLPEIISSHAILIGRIIVESGATTGFTIESAFTDAFAATTSITDHGFLTGLADDDHPQYAQKVSALDFEITDATKGVILKSSNGTRYRLTISNDGELTTTSI